MDLNATLGADPGQVAVARRLLRGYLTTRRPAAPDDTHDVSVLLVSELVTNAILHAGPPVTLKASTDGALLRVEVHDGASDPPVVRPLPGSADHPAERGRGLFLVASLADRWGWENQPTGKSVWFELEVG